MDYSRMGGVYGPDPEQMALISRLKDQNAATTPGQVAPPVRMPTPPAAAAPPQQADYGVGPAGPASPSAQGRGPSTAPSGWDNAKWNDPSKHDPKYDVGHILSSVAVNGKISGDQVAAALPQIQKLYPGATFDGKDALTIPGFDPIDVIRGADAGGGTGDLQWYVPGGGDPIGMTTGTAGTAPTAPANAPPMDDAFWQQLMAKLKLGQGQDPSVHALTATLRG